MSFSDVDSAIRLDETGGRSRKFAMAGCHRQHAGSVRSPENGSALLDSSTDCARQIGGVAQQRFIRPRLPIRLDRFWLVASTLFTIDQSRSLPCGFGTISRRPCLRMNGSDPPSSGPLQPSTRNRRMSSRRLIGLGINELARIQINAIQHRQRVAVTQSANDPGFERASQIFPAGLQSVALAP